MPDDPMRQLMSGPQNPMMPPDWLQALVRSAAQPYMQAGNYLGGLMQGSQQFNPADTVQQGGQLAMALIGPRLPLGRVFPERQFPQSTARNQAVDVAIAAKQDLIDRGYRYSAKDRQIIDSGNAPISDWYSGDPAVRASQSAMRTEAEYIAGKRLRGGDFYDQEKWDRINRLLLKNEANE